MPSDNCFTCNTCRLEFNSPVYSISKQYERVTFFEEPLIPVVDVIDAESIAEFCSPGCRDKKSAQVLKHESVCATYPDIGPIETCSRCGGIVLMTNYHKTYIEDACEIDWGQPMSSLNVLDAQMVAVVCQKCAPLDTAVVDICHADLSVTI